MKIYLTSIFLLFSTLVFGQFYDDFSDGNYTANPRWFMSDMEAQIVTTSDGYAVELHPTGEIEENSMKKGSFRTANTLIDNTWWGCDLTFDINKNSEGEIRFYLMSTLPNLESGEGYILSIDLKENKLVFARTKDNLLNIDPIITQHNVLNNGTINFSCKITKQKTNWTIICYSNEKKIWQEDISSSPNFNSATSTGFLVIENPKNPYNLHINHVNCGDKPAETEMIKGGEIIISEIMAKPNPAVKLPEVEWIEIYNTTDRTLSLKDCKISTSTKSGTFNDYILEPHEYAVICSYNAALEMTEITDKICIVESMPSLTNDGNLLILKNKQNHNISFVDYSINWYESEPFKADGGWSLERRDLSNPLSNSVTWVPSIDPRGGTPAEENSTTCSLPDLLIPNIMKIGIENENFIKVYFNKPIQGETIELQKNIKISGNSLKSLNWIEPQHEILEIYLNEKLDSLNSIDISFYNFECISGWSMNDTTISIALPHQAKYMDIIFNELMPYVNKENSKFIELHNNSIYYIDLNQLMLSNRDDENNLNNSKIFCSSSTILPPQQYAIITPDTSSINCFLGINPQSIYITSTLPSMPATEGKLVLSDRGGNIIDEIHYNEKWHHPLLKDLHNISLERINPNEKTQDATNWHSASSSVGYNTAGWENSQTVNNSFSSSQKHFWLKESTFSPNNDGYQDLLTIYHNLPTQGYTITIDAYTRNGTHINRIIDNQLSSPQGYTLWDGTFTDNSQAPIGLYILYIQAINPDKDKITCKLIAIKTS